MKQWRTGNMITSATTYELRRALDKTNEQYEGNLEFNRLDRKGSMTYFTLRVKNSHGLGARLGYPIRDWKTGQITGKSRHLVSACWHAHGHFFEALLEVNKNVWIKSRGKECHIDKSGGNWEDFDVGSLMNPCYLSELCECGEREEMLAEAKEGIQPQTSVYF